jgi:hypothetical protein
VVVDTRVASHSTSCSSVVQPTPSLLRSAEQQCAACTTHQSRGVGVLGSAVVFGGWNLLGSTPTVLQLHALYLYSSTTKHRHQHGGAPHPRHPAESHAVDAGATELWWW